MNTKTIIQGSATALAVAGLTFLLVVQVNVKLHPFNVGLHSPGTAYGYSSSNSALCSNLEAYWKLDESTGSQAADISENDRHGTLQNMADGNWSASISSALGFENDGSLVFDGTEESVSVSAVSGLRITGDLSLSLWMNYDALSSAASGNVLLSHGTTGETAADNMLYQLSMKSDNTLRLQWESSTGTDTSVESSSAATTSAGEWLHIAVTRDSTAGEVKFYASGVIIGLAQTFSSDPTGGTDGNLVIGASAEGINYFDGKLDDVRIYSAVLTGGQILALAGGSDIYGGCSCGNSTVESPETCDNGASNSDTTANACRNTCRIASCGDGVTDASETCDDGSSNSNTVADACRTNCSAASCGDGVVDTGEACDDGNNVTTDSCTNNCTISTCGDEVIQDGEECDDGDANSDTESNACRTTCLLPSCGDSVADIGEACDAGEATAACDTDCTVPVCGDGIANSAAGEACDDGDSNSDSTVDACRTDCTAASCGDSVVDTGESCDDGNTDSTDTCTTLCKNAGCGDGHIQTSNNETCEPPNTGTCASNCTGLTGGGGSSNNRSRSQSTTGVTSGTVEDEEEEEFEELEPPPEGCGNRIWEPDKEEECDEGNHNGRGPCSYYCKLLYCGDGVVSGEIFEECEPQIASVKDGIPYFDEQTCGDNGCSIPDIDPVSGRVTGGCKRLFLPSCESETETPQASVIDESAICGNFTVEGGEMCDDGNIENGDGCSSICLSEDCGDGVVQDGEDCDNGSICSTDANRGCINNLGCGVQLECEENEENVKTCGGTLEGDPCLSAFDCSFFGTCNYNTDANTSCTSVCTFSESTVSEEVAVVQSFCGDGSVNDDEECDDGNVVGGDGCSAFCVKEKFCGDGAVDEGEECDDGNTEGGDGCTVLCKVEELFQIPGQQTTTEQTGSTVVDIPIGQRIYADVCGNRIVEEGEDCDDGEQNSDTDPNTCRTDCSLPHCGDGVLDLNEECDAGTNNSGTRPDSCRPNCTIPTCGDFVIDSGESCDGGLSCQNNCRFILTEANCGNGTMEFGEECDDGNNFEGDGCNAQCINEPTIFIAAICGNGKRERGEDCDDGNPFGGDGCSAVCTVDSVLQQGQVPPTPVDPATFVAGESLIIFPEQTYELQPMENVIERVLPDVQKPVEEQAPETIVFDVFEPEEQITEPQVQESVQNQWQMLAQLQLQYAQLAGNIIPISPRHTPIGDTGPAAIIVLTTGAAAGVGYIRKRKR